MIKKIINFIQKHSKEENVLFVLKGFTSESFLIEKSYLENVIKNKVMYLVMISQQKNKMISYDEFICIYDFIIAQYSKIYIIENGLYANLFPLNVILPDRVVTSLVAHFNDDVESNEPIDDISEYTNIYSNFIQTENGYACCYNLPDNYLKMEGDVYENQVYRSFMLPDRGRKILTLI